MISRVSILALFGLLASALPLLSQQEAAVLGNPFNAKADVVSGQEIFAQQCADCHGKEGQGLRGPALDRGRFRHAGTDEELYKVISMGVAGTEMPGFSLSGIQTWQLIAYIRSLGAGKAAVLAEGDRAKGEELFFEKGGCGNCHRVRGRGGSVGPDLSRIGPQRSLGQLEASLLRPNEEVLPQNQEVVVTKRNGEKLTGRRLNEDTFSLQLLDRNQRLISLRREDIIGYVVRQDSPMPSYQGKFNATEFKNLIAFLAGLGQ